MLTASHIRSLVLERAPLQSGSMHRVMLVTMRMYLRFLGAHRAALAGGYVMLKHDVYRYIELHRSMGFKFRIQGSLLRNYVTFAEARGDRFIQTSRAVEWAGQGPSAPQRYNRLATVRRCALARAVGLRAAPGQLGPRLHDRGHTFAVRSLEQCCSDRQSIARHIAGLSTYLGHAHVSDTYWYLQASRLSCRNICRVIGE